jgi:hypothetical protein
LRKKLAAQNDEVARLGDELAGAIVKHPNKDSKIVAAIRQAYAEARVAAAGTESEIQGIQEAAKKQADADAARVKAAKGREDARIADAARVAAADSAAFSIGNLKRLADEAGNLGAAQDTYIAALKKLWRKQAAGTTAWLNALLAVKAAENQKGQAVKGAKDEQDKTNAKASAFSIGNLQRLADEAGNMGAAQDNYIAELRDFWHKQAQGSMEWLNALNEVRAAEKARGAATRAAKEAKEAADKLTRDDAAAFKVGNLERLANEAKNQGAAQERFENELRRRWLDAKAGSTAWLAALAALKTAENQRTAAANGVRDAKAEADRATQEALVANVKLSIDLQNARLATQLARAEATPGKADDKVALQAQVNFNEILLKNERKLQVGVDATTKKYKDREITIQGLIQANIALNQSIKDLKDTASGGFSLQDLFKESLSQFAEFGSNVSTNPVTPGQVRGQFAQGLLSTIMSRPQDRKELELDRVAVSTDSMDTTLKNIERLLRGDTTTEKGSGLLGDSVWGAGLKSSTTAKKLARIGP